MPSAKFRRNPVLYSSTETFAWNTNSQYVDSMVVPLSRVEKRMVYPSMALAVKERHTIAHVGTTAWTQSLFKAILSYKSIALPLMEDLPLEIETSATLPNVCRVETCRKWIRIQTNGRCTKASLSSGHVDVISDAYVREQNFTYELNMEVTFESCRSTTGRQSGLALRRVFKPIPIGLYDLCSGIKTILHSLYVKATARNGVS